MDLKPHTSTLLTEQFHIEAFTALQHVPLPDLHVAQHGLYVFTHGKGAVAVDAQNIGLTKGHILVLSKEQPYRFLKNNLQGYHLQFTDAFWKQTPISANNCKAVLFDSTLIKHRLLIDTTVLKDLIVPFKAALTEYERADYSNKPDVLAAYLKIIVIKIANVHALLTEDIGSINHKIYQDFMALVNSEAKLTHHVAAYAAKLGISVRQLSNACHAQGKGAKKIINMRLVSEAKNTLQFSTKSIKEVAIDLSFSSPYQFSNFFKKHTGLAPENYRKQFVKIGISIT